MSGEVTAQEETGDSFGFLHRPPLLCPQAEQLAGRGGHCASQPRTVPRSCSGCVYPSCLMNGSWKEGGCVCSDAPSGRVDTFMRAEGGDSRVFCPWPGSRRLSSQWCWGASRPRIRCVCQSTLTSACCPVPPETVSPQFLRCIWKAGPSQASAQAEVPRGGSVGSSLSPSGLQTGTSHGDRLLGGRFLEPAASPGHGAAPPGSSSSAGRTDGQTQTHSLGSPTPHSLQRPLLGAAPGMTDCPTRNLFGNWKRLT